MGIRSRRSVLVASTLVLLSVIGIALLLALRESGQPRYYVRVDELVGDSRYFGQEVRFGGEVVSWNGTELVLRPEDSDTPTVSVALADPSPGLSAGPGVVVIGEGVFTESGTITDADVIVPSGPTRFEEHPSE